VAPDPRCAALAVLVLPALAVAAPAAAAPAKPRDRDGDGFSDRLERRLGTSPRKRDTDGDRLSDRRERRLRTNPRRRDTDRDGLADGTERRRGSDPRDPDDPRPRKRGLREGPVTRDDGPEATPPLPPPPPPPPPDTAPALPACDVIVSSLGGVGSAVAVAAPGAVVCLADGSYGRLSLTATKAAPGVTVRAQHPGQATLAGATLDGAHLTVARFRLIGSFDARPGSTGMTADHNLFDLNAYTGYGVMACASTTTTCNDVTIRGNRFVGRSEEDAIRANRYHDGPDADPHGLLVEGNEFTGNQETGGHNDVFQSVWVGDGLTFRRNYLHDFGGQGFFVKDQASPIVGLVVEDNLIVRQDLPCDPGSLCPTWQLSPFQIFGPISGASIRNNTVWAAGDGVLRGSGWADAVFADNVFDKLGQDPSVTVTGANNTRCRAVLSAVPGTTSLCAPPFPDAALGDLRIPGGRGVTWSPAQVQFGP
jgi:hypothetical protein